MSVVRLLRRSLLKFGLILVLSTCMLLLYLHTPQDLDRATEIEIIERTIRSPMNRGQCRHPDLPIDNPEIMKFYKPVEKINCGNQIDWVMCEKSICFVKPEISSSHREIICSYTDLIRKSDHKVRYGKTIKTKEPYILQESDFVRVVCNADSGHSWFGMAVGIRDTVQRTISPNLTPEFMGALPIEQQQEPLPGYYNILMFGFDSLSRNAFIRKLPKTYAYLTQQLGAVVLKGYNIVGDGTPQALVPLLTGFTELELPETRKRKHNSAYVNVYPMIWKRFAQLGYVTSFNEDLPNVGTFTYRMNGFEEQPVDHYLRTYFVEALNIWSESKVNCIGQQPDHLVMLEYTKNFMTKYKDSPRFVFSFHGGLSHDSINLIGAADDDVEDWLSTLKEKSLLDNTILIFMADHGNRFADVRATLQGKQEERLPFFSFAFPASFKKRFPREFTNFMKNSEHLTTPFDVHATLKQLAEMQTPTVDNGNINYAGEERTYKATTSQLNGVSDNIQISEIASQRAISLFEEIPANRSCAEAYIEPHWCACLDWLPIQLNDTKYTHILLKVAASIMNAINEATIEYRTFCAPLELQKINWAMRLRPTEQLLHFKQNSDVDGFMADLSGNTRVSGELYQLQIVAQPGHSLFEASVTYNLDTFTAHTKLTEVSRVNKYGSQANCIYERNPELRKYCYCRA